MRQLFVGLMLLGLTAAPRAPRPVEPWTDRLVTRTAQQDSAFGRLIARLSESGGYFDSDNLISNETSYLHVVGAMTARKVTGGAYIGVGPDQNFSYIARIRPSVAVLIDIRRDNLLQHLFLKALFALSRNRAEYLSLLVGRTPPPEGTDFREKPITALVAYVDGAAPRRDLARARATVEAQVGKFGVALSDSDVVTIRQIHDQFVALGLDLRFTSAGRPPREYYPTLRDLLLAEDLAGEKANYLATEESFQLLKSMEARDLIVPVVGNLAGPRAMSSIGRWLLERNEPVSAFYTSNVEFYLMRDGTFPRFAENVKRLPRDRRSVIIRSYFGGPWREPHPMNVPGFFSTQLLQSLDSFVQEYDAGGYVGYWELVTKHQLGLK